MPSVPTIISGLRPHLSTDAMAMSVKSTPAPLMTIVNLDNVWVTAQVPEDRLNGIAPGLAADVTLAAYPGQPMHGRVGFVSPQLESDTRRAKVRISLGNADGRLKPNMFASVQFTIPQAAAVTVPTSA